MLERRVDDLGNEDAEFHDSFFGFADALRRSEVNLLFARTFQLGYDLIGVEAVCELPSLRDRIRTLCNLVDEAGAHTEAAREGLPDTLDLLATRDVLAFSARARAFQELGKLLTKELSELEARLLLMDALRRTVPGPSEAANFYSSYRKRENFSLLAGTGASLKPDPPDVDDDIDEAVRTAWFLNHKVTVLGENIYFMGEHHVEATQSLPFARYREIALQDEVPGFLKDLIGGARRSLNLHWLSGGSSVPTARARRFERMQAGRVSADWRRSFFQRQAISPLRISTMPTLAYARFWALAGGQGPNTPLGFHAQSDGLASDEIQQAYDLLNRATGAAEDPESREGLFGPGAVAIGSVRPEDMLIRFRFVRNAVAPCQYITAHIKYTIHSAGNNLPNSIGLMSRIVSRFAREGFRVERISNSLLSRDASSEVGRLQLVLRSTCDRGDVLCKSIKELTRLEREVGRVKHASESGAPTEMAEPDKRDKIEVHIKSGITLQ